MTGRSKQDDFDCYYRGQGFIILKKAEEYQINWLVGAFCEEVSYPISAELVEKSMRSDRDAYEVMIYVQTGSWPLTAEEKEQANLAFLRRHPELLIKVPENQKKFNQKELKTLLARGKRVLEK